MSLELECPSCGRTLRVPESAVGKNVRCPGCKEVFTARAVADSESEPVARRQLPAHRGDMVLTLGILGAVFSVVGIPTMFCGFCCPPLGVAGSVLSLPFAISAWVMGQGDLRKMRTGQMDASGLGKTQAGWICGLAGTILGSITTVVTLVWWLMILAGAATSPNRSFEGFNGKAGFPAKKSDKKTGILTRQEFRNLVMGRSFNEVQKAVGAPDSTQTLMNMEFWNYSGKTKDEATGKVDLQIQVVFEDGFVTAVNFF